MHTEVLHVFQRVESLCEAQTGFSLFSNINSLVMKRSYIEKRAPHLKKWI